MSRRRFLGLRSWWHTPWEWMYSWDGFQCWGEGREGKEGGRKGGDYTPYQWEVGWNNNGPLRHQHPHRGLTSFISMSVPKPRYPTHQSYQTNHPQPPTPTTYKSPEHIYPYLSVQPPQRSKTQEHYASKPRGLSSLFLWFCMRRMICMLPCSGLQSLLRSIYCCGEDKKRQERQKGGHVLWKPASTHLLAQFISCPLSDQIRKNIPFHRIINVLTYNLWKLWGHGRSEQDGNVERTKTR